MSSTPPISDFSGLTAAPCLALEDGLRERHTIFLLLSMALVFDGWGIHLERAEHAARFAAVDPTREFSDYLGHNVGALLVGPDWSIISFALNRNVELNSTLEHAEARAVRHAISIGNAAAGPSGPRPWSFGDLLRGGRLYATLEPCSQCAGIIELANLECIVYAQDDPLQCGIVNVLYNLHQRPGVLPAPRPIRATFQPFWDELSAGHAEFAASAPAHGRTGLTSFLETPEAYGIYRRAAMHLNELNVEFAENEFALSAARSFRRNWGSAMNTGLAPAT